MKVSVKKFAAAIREMAQKFTEVKYLGYGGEDCDCFYDSGNCSNGSVGCLLGQAAKQFGLELIGSNPIGFIFKDEFYFERDDPAGEWWAKSVQKWQDFSNPWGVCVKLADHELANHEKEKIKG